ncbi:LysR family transcriptional regulator [Acidomonas methanolica]|uniref:LysR family transcriptional regulator n=1 Tax=Acidomonas methanolica TaxID=437 RepID=UPI001FB683A0|nr:LysR family transcriptional regulator [Acidomonas methanolica]
MTRAAERLSLTQPAVSSALRRLRECCRDELFVRTRHAMQPTAYAEQIARALEDGVEILRTALSEHGSFDPRSSTRSFVIGSEAGLDYTLGPIISARLQEVAPDVTMTFRQVGPAAMAGALEHREIDLALSTSQTVFPHCRSTMIGHFRFVCVWHPDHGKLPPHVTVAELTDRPHVLIEAATRYSVFDYMLRNLGIRRQVRVLVPSFGHLPSFLSRTSSIAVVPDYIGFLFSATTMLCVSTLPEIFGEHSIQLIVSQIGESDTGRAWLQDFVRDIAVAEVTDVNALSRGVRNRHL